jgi:hypothetical protein
MKHDLVSDDKLNDDHYANGADYICDHGFPYRGFDAARYARAVE